MNELSLAAEEIERAALAGLHEAAGPRLREELGLRLEESGGVLVSIARNEPSTLLNRAIGLGIGQEASRETVRAVRGLYESSGVSRFYLHLHPEARPAGIRSLIEEEGLSKGRGWQKFRRGPDAAPEARSDLRVKEVGREHGEAFGAIVAGGFGLGEAAARLLAELPGRPGWRVFMTFDAESPAGCGALFVHEGCAWLDWAATHPDFRRRGAQALVLAARIRAASETGCRHIFTATGEAVEGDPQHSYKNILRSGFEPLYLRENWAPALRPPPPSRS